MRRIEGDIDRDKTGNMKIKERTSAGIIDVHRARHAVEEATAELLAAEGDPFPDQIKGELSLDEEKEYNSTTTMDEVLQQQYAKDNTLLEKVYNVSFVNSMANMLAIMISRMETSLLHLGRRIIDAQQSDSWIIGLASKLASGPLRQSLLRFNANLSDHSRRLLSIRANAKFASITSDDSSALSDPGGDLGAVVKGIKEKYGVKFIYAWHAMGGFWGGLSVEKGAKGDEAVAKYNPKMLNPIPTPGMLLVDPSLAWNQPVLAGISLPLDPRALHNDLHAYLASCGIDGVKTDVQSTIGLAGSAVNGGPAFAATYHDSLEDSIKANFPGNHLINCMCHSTEDLYNMRESNWARASDDFYPLRPASHTAHVANCAYNSLFLGEIVGVDWDMFHSRHPAALLHATARAVSGGPVYVSDKPGHHDFDLLRRLVLPDSSVLRCPNPARPTLDCLLRDVSCDNKTVLKVWNTNNVTGVIGVFNVQGSTFSRSHRRFHSHDPRPPTLSAVVRPVDVPNLYVFSRQKGCTSYAMYSDRLQELYIVDMDHGTLPLEIPASDCDVIVLSPIVSRSGISCAPIGLPAMLNAGGAVLDFSLSDGSKDNGNELTNSQVHACVMVRGCGRFLMYASHAPTEVRVADSTVEFEFKEKKKSLAFDIGSAVSTPRECTITFQHRA